MPEGITLTPTLSSRDYQNAIDMLDGVNLSGIVRSWCLVLPKIRAVGNRTGAGTNFVNTHPISVLYATKCAELSGTSFDSTTFGPAYETCKQKAGAGHKAA